VREVVDATGCCGVAGNFGFEAQHYDLSMQVAEKALAPTLRGTAEEDPVLTDGFSCAMQVDHLDPQRPGTHLAQLLDPGPSSGPGEDQASPGHRAEQPERDQEEEPR
jgi:Fe-S oxidoreductase